jgi:hypothetical protein
MTATLTRPGTAARRAPPPAVQPLDLDFTDFAGPSFSFELPAHTVLDIEFHTLAVGTLLLEVQTDAGPFVGRMMLNTHRLEGTVSIAVGTGVYRLNYAGPGLATVSIAGP